jgi:hypothetical protein
LKFASNSKPQRVDVDEINQLEVGDVVVGVIVCRVGCFFLQIAILFRADVYNKGLFDFFLWGRR